MATGNMTTNDEPGPLEDPLAPGPETGNFLLQLSHDLKTSLRGIRVHAELFAKELAAGQAADFAHHLNVIVQDTAKIESLANGLAGYSIACQIEQTSFVQASLEVLLRRVLAKLATELRENGAIVTYDPLPRIRCDPDRIGQLFENLVHNGLVHRASTPLRVQISAEEQGDRWLFRVRDNGPGIESTYLERIFEPFERLRGSRATGPGLGLTICREIVKKHGGRIWAQSEPGKGATFLFTLPREALD
jgi:chemotaxis family two-component system sensor kinase Cph1